EAKLVDQAQGVILQGESSRAWAILDASQDSPQPILLPDWFQAPIGRSITLWQKEGDAWQERAIKRRNAGHTGFTPKVEQNYQAWLENPSRRIVLDKNRQAQVMNLQAKNLQELKSSCLLLEIKMRNEPSELRIRSGSGMWFQLALMEGPALAGGAGAEDQDALADGHDDDNEGHGDAEPDDMEWQDEPEIDGWCMVDSDDEDEKQPASEGTPGQELEKSRVAAAHLRPEYITLAEK
ncbi:unnamed protein product, partial [Durusdinium trenchii]